MPLHHRSILYPLLQHILPQRYQQPDPVLPQQHLLLYVAQQQRIEYNRKTGKSLIYLKQACFLLNIICPSFTPLLVTTFDLIERKSHTKILKFYNYHINKYLTTYSFLYFIYF
jgi:hypothetical protein